MLFWVASWKMQALAKSSSSMTIETCLLISPFLYQESLDKSSLHDTERFKDASIISFEAREDDIFSVL